MTRTLNLSIVALLAACTTPPQITGRVVDIWGAPVEGALVKAEGLTARPRTDAYGRFALPLTEGALAIKAGREGYIQDDIQIVVADGKVQIAGGSSDEPTDSGTSAEVILELFPIPTEKGFHVIGSDRYHKVQPKLVRAVGNNLGSLYGIRETGGISVDGEELRFVYHGDLRLDQLMALDVSLHKLNFIERAEMLGITTTDVKLDLYVSDATVPIEITRLKSRNDYLIRVTEPIERQRVYALTTNHLLDPPDDDAFQRIAPALRLAFPIEIR